MRKIDEIKKCDSLQTITLALPQGLEPWTP